MGAPEFLQLVKESAYGTIMPTPVAGTDSFFIRLTEGNSFSVNAEPQFTDIPYGGGFAVTAESLSDTVTVVGQLKTKLYPSQDQFLLNWALARINAGQTTPWTTTEIPGDLASVSAYHAYTRSDGTLKRTRYAGGKVGQLTLEGSRGNPVWALTLDCVFQKPVGNAYDASTDPDVTEFPAPADTDYPTGPYQFAHTSGGWAVGGGAYTSRTQFDSVRVSVQNALDPRPFESRYLQSCQNKGRQITLDAAMRLKATPDDRAAFEALTDQNVKLTLNTGAATCVLDFLTRNKIRKWTRDLPLDKVFMANIQLKNVWSASAGNDLALTYT
jgi:hypothetical protein